MANVQYKGLFFGANQAGKSVTVTVTKTAAAATLTSDRNAASSLSNPVTVAADGTVSFFTAPGRYTLTGNGQTQDITLVGDTSVADTTSAITGSKSTGGTSTITTPTAPGSTYAQSEAAAMKTAVDALRVQAAANAAVIAQLLTVLNSKSIITDSTT